MRDINIKIKRRDFVIFSLVIVFLIAGGIVISYNPGGTATPSIMGHSANEIEGLPAGSGGGCSFGEWEITATLASGGTETLTPNHVYRADKDGFVTFYTEHTLTNEYTYFYSDLNINPPTTLRVLGSGGFTNLVQTIPVPKDAYWKLSATASDIKGFFWMPLDCGAGGGGSGGSQLKIGSYVGNKIEPHSITGVGFKPDYVQIIPNRGAVHDDVFVKTSDMPSTASRRYSTAAGSWYDDGGIISLDADGFTVGNTADLRHINEAGVTYSYVAMKEG